jgi:hypothetical protein
MSGNVSELATPVQAPHGVFGVIAELLRLQREATEDSISSDLDRARALIACLPESERGEGERLYLSLCQLERWLHDR